MGINQQKAAVIIAAGGSSQRMGDIDKLFSLLGGKPVLARTIDAFQRCARIQQIIIVLSQQNLKKGDQLLSEQGWVKVTDICPGGRLRQDSVTAGIKLLKPCEWVIIHDGARPLVTQELINQGIDMAEETGSAVAAIPVTDTIKVAGDNMIVQGTPPRQNLWSVQTPQVFRFDIINEAYSNIRHKVTDDAKLVEQLGYKVKLYMGSYDNIKITNPEDLDLANILWQKYEK
ncbi:2-C-methyl-D-erythritol 4-phosphate cytidylyltransferase [Chloroflexota bacterium]